jgi:hypothetical protein
MVTVHSATPLANLGVPSGAAQKVLVAHRCIGVLGLLLLNRHHGRPPPSSHSFSFVLLLAITVYIQLLSPLRWPIVRGYYRLSLVATRSRSLALLSVCIQRSSNSGGSSGVGCETLSTTTYFCYLAS